MGRALTDAPYFPQAHFNYGAFLMGEDRPAEAIRAFRRAVELAPKYSAAYHALVVAHLALGERQQAEETYEALALQTPASPATRAAQRLLAQELGRRLMKPIHGFLLVVSLSLISCGVPDREPAAVETDLDPGVVAVFDGGTVNAQDIDERIPRNAAGRAESPRRGTDGLVRRSRPADRRGIATAKRSIGAGRRRLGRVRRDAGRGSSAGRDRDLSRDPSPDLFRASEPRRTCDAATKNDRRRCSSQSSVGHFISSCAGKTAKAQKNSKLVYRNFVSVRSTARASPDSPPGIPNRRPATEKDCSVFSLPGQLEPNLEAVIFRLAEGVPSEPVLSGDGGHLFLVDSLFPKRQLAFDEVARSTRCRPQSGTPTGRDHPVGRRGRFAGGQLRAVRRGASDSAAQGRSRRGCPPSGRTWS